MIVNKEQMTSMNIALHPHKCGLGNLDDLFEYFFEKQKMNQEWVKYMAGLLKMPEVSDEKQ